MVHGRTYSDLCSRPQGLDRYGSVSASYVDFGAEREQHRHLRAAQFQFGGRGIERRDRDGEYRDSGRLRALGDASNQLVFMSPPDAPGATMNEARIQLTAKIDWNKPCLCGSGRMFKHCHGDPADEDRTGRAFEAAASHRRQSVTKASAKVQDVT
jgi:SEC-C motif